MMILIDSDLQTQWSVLAPLALALVSGVDGPGRFCESPVTAPAFK